jgi:signal transduction histidine kinase
VIVYVLADRQLSEEVDAAMRGVSDQAAAAVNQKQATIGGGGQIGISDADVAAVLSQASLGRGADVFVLLVNPDRSIASNAAAVSTVGLPDTDGIDAATRHGEDWRASNIDGHDVRIRTLAVRAPDGSVEGYIQAGKSLEERDRSLRILLLVIGGGGIAGLVLSAAGGLVVAGIALRPVRRGFERQREFVADASHELRTPLAVIRTNAETLAVTRKDESVDDIVAESAYMTRLLDDLLLLARGDQEGIELSRSRCDLSEIARGGGRAAERLAEDAGLRFEASIDGALPVEADAQRCHEVVLILVDNAVKYTPRNGEVTLKTRRDGGDAVLEVADNGVGVAATEIPRLFDRFYRVDKARSRLLGGAGLGLSIAREILDAHGGTIELKSELGKGTVVTVRLPIAK